MKVTDMIEKAKGIIVLAVMLLVTVGVSSSAHTDLLVEDIFLLTIGTEDEYRSSPGEPYYIRSAIEFRSFDVTSTHVGDINHGPVTRVTDVRHPGDDARAFAYFNDIPAGSLVRYENKASGYVSDVDEIYLDTGLPRALFDDEERYFEYEEPQGYKNTENSFTTDCDFDVDEGLPYYTCSVSDKKDYSITYYLILTHLEGEGDMLFPEVIVTNKLWPEDKYEEEDEKDDDDEKDKDDDESDDDEDEKEDDEKDDESDKDEDKKDDEHDPYDVSFRRMRTEEGVYSPGDMVAFDLTLENRGRDLEGARAHVILMGMDNDEYRRYTVGPFNLINDDDISVRRHIQLPEDIGPGTYHIRVSVGDGGYRMVRHKEIVIR